MITAQIRKSPFETSFSIGHFLLLSWIRENTERRDLFESCMLHITSKFDHEIFTTIVDTAAKRCWLEFQEQYLAENGKLSENDVQGLYSILEENYQN